MKGFLGALFVACCGVTAALGSQNLERVRQLEESGDALGARTLLARAAQNGRDVTSLKEYAEFLDRYNDPAAKDAYVKLLAALDQPGEKQERAAVARRLAEISTLNGDRAAAQQYLETYRQAGGAGAVPSWQASTIDSRQYIQIPGPLHSFDRMAAISSELQLDDMLTSLARNVVTNGFQAAHGNEALEQTEYLKLVHRYLSQARARLDKAGRRQQNHQDRELRLVGGHGELLRILGYRMRGGCGGEVVLETVNASRAFLTTDSGFPLHDLEQALRTNRPYTYDYHPTRVPVLFGADYWLTPKEKETSEFIDVFLSDPALCRLYLGLSKLDRETAEVLHKDMSMPRLKAYAHVLDFFGGMFEIRDGKALVPGAPRTIPIWTELVGAPPDQGTAFFEKLIGRDDGWMASYFDALARMNGPVKRTISRNRRA